VPTRQAATATEKADERDRPTGAEAAPGWSRRKPRVDIRRGRTGLAAVAKKPLTLDPAEQLRAELRRWSLCRTFVHQFEVMAKPAPPVPAKAKVGRRGKKGKGGVWRSYALPLKRKRGLAAVKARDDPGDLSFETEQEAIRAFYGAKIEATRRSLPKLEAGAAVRALLVEQSLAFKALAERRQAESAARRASHNCAPIPSGLAKKVFQIGPRLWHS